MQHSHKAILRDGRELNLTKQQYLDIRNLKSTGKRNDMISISNSVTKEMMFDWEIGDIKEFREIFKSLVGFSDDAEMRSEASRRKANKIKREQWLDNFLKECENPEKMLEDAKEEARKRMTTSVAKGWIWDNFITQYARTIIRLSFWCPYP